MKDAWLIQKNSFVLLQNRLKPSNLALVLTDSLTLTAKNCSNDPIVRDTWEMS